MKIHKLSLFIITVISCSSFNSASAAGRNTSSVLKSFAPGMWVASDNVIKKNTFCYREYTCKARDSFRFGRNVRSENIKLQRSKSACAGPVKTCQCNTAPPVSACEVELIRRR